MTKREALMTPLGGVITIASPSQLDRWNWLDQHFEETCRNGVQHTYKRIPALSREMPTVGNMEIPASF